MNKTKINSSVYYLATVSLGVAFTVVASWISIPFLVNFSLQTMVIFIISALLGFRKSMISVLIYIFLGIIGLPIFSGFGAGIGVVSGPHGGFILGFLFIPPLVSLFTAKTKNLISYIFAMLISVIPCYVLGTLWYGCIFADSSVWSILMICIVPFLFPELVKVLLAAVIVCRLKKIQSKFNPTP